MKKVSIILMSFVFFTSCSQDPEDYIEHLSGYWEIDRVEKNNDIIKDYSISTMVDYFEMTNTYQGFRKKVSPKLDGSYIVTQHDSPFTLKIENNKLNIYYSINNVTFKETIKFASKDALIISNADGFTYIYKPFTQISL